MLKLDNDNDLHLLVATLPVLIQDALQRISPENLLEIVLDLGRPPQARYPKKAITLLERPVTFEDINHVAALLGEFGEDNRAGIEGTLHRISALRNRKGKIVGLTLRVGRAVHGTIDVIRDLVESGSSILLLGPPGVGKTTKLREIARVLADDFFKRVMIIDTSNEIGGDGDIPHPAVGMARRLQVPRPEHQHAVMIEAVENHMPEVIIVDEIGTIAETMAARTIAERGVQLIGTAHGNTLENLVSNPSLADLIGGIQAVILSDEEARMRGTQKTITERKGPPTFSAVVEIIDRESVIVHTDTAQAVDQLLRGLHPGGLRRTEAVKDTNHIMQAPPRSVAKTSPASSPRNGAIRIYANALSRDSVERAMRDIGLSAKTVKELERANIILTLKARENDPKLRPFIESGIPAHSVKKNTTAQIRHALRNIFNILEGTEQEEINAAVREAEDAAHRVLNENIPVELSPRNSGLRQIQHRIAVRYQLVAESVGGGAMRHLVIYPNAAQSP